MNTTARRDDPRAPAPDPYVRTGMINFVDTHIGVWEENVDEGGLRLVMRQVIARLTDHRGFKFGRDPRVLTSYPTIAPNYLRGRKGDLECKVHVAGRTLQFEFFQNLNVSNPNGGEYDSYKFARMPRTMQLQCAVEMAHVLRKLVELGYVLESRGITTTDALSVLRHAQGRTDENDPVAISNRRWTGYKRDESGWLDASEYRRWPAKDRDGVPIVSGDLVYTRERGRLFRGVARPNMNDMWIVVTEATRTAPATMIYVHARALFRCEAPDREPRRFFPEQFQRMERELERAVKSKDYRRASQISTALVRASAIVAGA